MAGYTGDGGADCLDIDECAIDNGGCGGTDVCVNTPGGHVCVPCPAGYSGAGDARCNDIDECAIDNGGCDLLTTCTNTVGGRICGECPEGYTGTGEVPCEDIDECLTDNGGCDPLTLCTNTAGGWTCGECPEGYTGTGEVPCEDIDECLTDNGGCDPLTLCTNTVGGWTCGECPEGYTGDGFTGCSDIDECLTDNGGCDPLTTCANTAGSRVCGECPEGYTGTGEVPCEDIDECLIDNGGCDPVAPCINTRGGWECGPCPDGTTGTGDTVCVIPGECLPNPCEYDGVCLPNGDGHTCQCAPGYGGVNCSAITVFTAGDIGNCSGAGDAATALLLDARPGPVLTLGDATEGNGDAADYADCFDPDWGRHHSRLLPTLGNHDYWLTSTNASGYLAYFATNLAGLAPSAVDPTQGYYSYDLASWHIVVLNGNCANVTGGCSAGSAQEQWLREDLAASSRTCTLAAVHQARYSSDVLHPSDAAYVDLWQALVDYGVEFVLSGHSHDYERWAPQDANGNAIDNGVVQFVVGTGGGAWRWLSTTQPTNSVVRDNATYGVLQLTLRPNGYDWKFLPVAGSTFTDTGTASCQ